MINATRNPDLVASYDSKETRWPLLYFTNPRHHAGLKLQWN